MRLKTLHIENYRQFGNSTINFENEITILAGSNNSGKTSLVELFGKLFGDTNNKFCDKDIPVMIIKKWSNYMLALLKQAFNEEISKDAVINNLKRTIQERKFNGENNIKEAIEKDSILINLEVNYDIDENIEKFSEYIMDLNDEVKSFFFQIKYIFEMDMFIKHIDSKFEQLKIRINKLESESDKEQKNNKERHLCDLIGDLFCLSFKEKYYYTDKNYKNQQLIDESKKFKTLFYYKHIIANREVDDERNDKKRSISKSMINYISNDDEWNKVIEILPDEIMRPLEEINIQGTIHDKSLKALSTVINQINSTNGGVTEEIILDMDIDEKSIKNFLNDITSAKYKVNDYYLDEAAQGLGYNHMIFMHLQIEDYLKKYNPLIVNFFIIEEPEAHMHPQMQKVFMQHLYKYYKNKNIQGMITTHSSEIIRVSEMKYLRVIRPLNTPFQKQIYDINQFLNSTKNRRKEIENFYNLLFGINFSSIIFADKIIMYEGDTERMYLNSILTLPHYKKLREQYISFIQVGGAYAHWYKEIIEFLNIKTLILTDIDYKKDLVKKDEIKQSYITNGAIKYFYYSYLSTEETIVENQYYYDNQLLEEVAQTKIIDEGESEDNEIKVQQLYEWQNNKNNIVSNNIMINFQGEQDHYTRTLEEAMLAKLLNIALSQKKSRDEWKRYKESYLLKFTVPNRTKNSNKKPIKKYYTIRDIVNATSDNKTDFMYSVIMGEHVEDTIPNYIRVGLEWLMN